MIQRQERDTHHAFCCQQMITDDASRTTIRVEISGERLPGAELSYSLGILPCLRSVRQFLEPTFSKRSLMTQPVVPARASNKRYFLGLYCGVTNALHPWMAYTKWLRFSIAPHAISL